METSDSEYFESADEDLSSEDESVISSKILQKSDSKGNITEKKIDTKQDITEKISAKFDKLDLEPTIEKIVSTSNTNKSTDKGPQEECTKKNISQEKSKVEVISSIIERTNQSLKPTNHKSVCDKQNYEILKDITEQHDKIKNPAPEPEKKQSCKNQKSSVAVESTSQSLQINLPKEEVTQLVENDISDKKNLETINTSSSKEIQENLWDDDDEIKWEEHEESRDTQKPDPKSDIGATKCVVENTQNNEDLWGDDELDWETEGQLEEKEKGSTEPIKQKAEDNLWQNDDWEPLEKPTDIPENKPEPQASLGWGGWNTWGVTSLLNTATQGVTTLTSHVSQGLSTVMEGGMGIPDPEQMAKENTHIKNKLPENHEEVPNSPQLFGLGNLVGSVSHITKFVESTSTKVISGGLDTLETIGKKTMEVLQDGDPGLKKKRAFLKLDTGKPVLSQVLRDAKEKAEIENRAAEQEHVIKSRKIKSYETLFDDYQGLVHLEALEMLSKLSNMKLEAFNDSLSGEALKEMQETMDQVKELCELPDDEEDQQLTLTEIKEKLDSAVEDLNITISYEKLLNTCEETDNWISNVSSNLINEEELHQQAIESLAQVTALGVEQFHKIGEHLLVKEHRSTADEADSLVQLTTVLKSLIVRQANKFTDKLSSIQTSDKNKSNELITNIFFEAANSSSYIQDAFQLLIPVLEVGAV